MSRTSRLPGFYRKSLVERAAIVGDWAGLSQEEQAIFFGLTGLNTQDADHMIENAVGIYALPLGVAVNFLINDRDYLIPMVVEEPSVVAAVSNAAKIIREGGGFYAGSDDPIMIGQIQIMDVDNVWAAAARVMAHREELLRVANDPTLTIVKRGGGARDIETRPFEDTAVGSMLVVHVLVDVRDAMGANVINTICERLAPRLETITNGRVNLRILSNYSDQRMAHARCMIPPHALATDSYHGEEVIKLMIEAAVFAEIDPYRATTHNKGVMNGIDAVAIATGNDWRAIEAGAHAYVCRGGRYTSMTQWWQDEEGNLRGSIQLPMAVGIVGGATKSHPTARVVMKILAVQTARELAEVMVSVGLAQNFAAIRALATEGIQQGHMTLHARQLAMAAGATGDLINQIVDIMLREKNIRLERAKELVKEFSGKQ